MKPISSFIYFFMCLWCVHSLHLPKYLKACKVRDASFKKCAIESGNAIIKTIMKKGDKMYNIPPADPLVFPAATVVSDNVNLNSTNISVYGLIDLTVTDVDVNLDERKILFEIQIPELTIHFNYIIRGKISAFIIEGQGPGVVKVYKGTYQNRFGFDLVERNKKQYMTLKNETFGFDAERMTFNFENLFDGNQNLAKQLTNYLNDNWRDVVAALGPSLKQIGVVLGKVIVDTLLQEVPIDEIFPDF